MRKSFLISISCFGAITLSSHAVAGPGPYHAGASPTKDLAHQFLLDKDAAKANDSSAYSGVVSETFQAGGYSYFRFKAKDKQYWAASVPVDLKVGDHVVLDSDAYPMHNFHSKTLNRTFDVILFTGHVTKKNQAAR